MSTMCAQHWDAAVELDQYSKDEILFWRKNLSSVKSRHYFLTKTPHIFAYSDASATGCEPVVSLDNEQVCHRLWDQSETPKSSTWRELAAIYFAIESFGPILEGTHVKWFRDNQAAAKIVQIGSMRFDLHRLATSIFYACIKWQVKLEIQWIPRIENQKADYISRLIDIDDWQITPAFFLAIDSTLGTHSVDCMANFYNTKIPRFFSRFWNPDTIGVDFFVQNLNSENCLVVPPISLVPRVLHCLPEHSESQSNARRTALALVQLLASYYVQLWTVH